MQSRLGDAALESTEVSCLLAASGGGLEKFREEEEAEQQGKASEESEQQHKAAEAEQQRKAAEEAEQQHKVESTKVKVLAKFVRLLTLIRLLIFHQQAEGGTSKAVSVHVGVSSDIFCVNCMPHYSLFVFLLQTLVDVCSSCGATSSSEGCKWRHTRGYDEVCARCEAAQSSTGCTLKHPRAYEAYTKGLGIFTKHKWMCCHNKDQAALGCTRCHPQSKHKWVCCGNRDGRALGCTRFHPALVSE